MTYNDFIKNFDGDPSFREFVVAHKLNHGEKKNFLDVHAEDKLWYPIYGSNKDVLFEVKDVSTEAKFNEPFMNLELYEPYSDSEFNAKLLYKKGSEITAWQFKDKNDKIIWCLIPEANIVKKPGFIGLEDCELCDCIGNDWVFTLYPSSRVVDILDEIGKEGKDFIKESKLHRLAYKDIFEETVYLLHDEQDLVVTTIEKLKEGIEAFAEEQKKVKVTIGGVEYVFSSAEEARAILGVNSEK